MLVQDPGIFHPLPPGLHDLHIIQAGHSAICSLPILIWHWPIYEMQSFLIHKNQLMCKS